MFVVFLAIFAAIICAVIILIQKKKQKPWADMTEKEKRIKIGLVIITAILVIIGITSLIFIF
jgi:uncharacterized Tic20 family protein